LVTRELFARGSGPGPAVGLDTNLLVRHTSALAATFKADISVAPTSKTY
jgi:hypothetical protein